MTTFKTGDRVRHATHRKLATYRDSDRFNASWVLFDGSDREELVATCFLDLVSRPGS
jgi:hypothetical protein